MAYMRGEHYIWTSESDLHIWSANGQDACTDSIWYQSHKDAKPAGVAIPQDVADEYVVMRFTELLAEETLLETIDRALTKGYGKDPLRNLAGLLTSIPNAPLAHEMKSIGRELQRLQLLARQAGLFIDDRELLTCLGCGLQEDVNIDGRLITYFGKPEKPEDCGMRFAETRDGFVCPNCSQMAMPAERE